MSVEDILSEYPSLEPAQVVAAQDYAGPIQSQAGHFPSTTLKRRVSAMAAAGIFDIDSAKVVITPEMFR